MPRLPIYSIYSVGLLTPEEGGSSSYIVEILRIPIAKYRKSAVYFFHIFIHLARICTLNCTYIYMWIAAKVFFNVVGLRVLRLSRPGIVKYMRRNRQVQFSRFYNFVFNKISTEHSPIRP